MPTFSKPNIVALYGQDWHKTTGYIFVSAVAIAPYI